MSDPVGAPSYPTLMIYEGDGEATLTPLAEDGSGRVAPVHFRLTQHANGDLSGDCSLHTDGQVIGEVAALRGETGDGWHVEVPCSIGLQQPWPWRETAINPQTITATRLAPVSSPVIMTAPVLNLAFPPRAFALTSLPWRGHLLDIRRVDNYAQRIEDLEEYGGILQTATLSTSAAPMSIEGAYQRVAEVTPPLSLATGRLVALAYAQFQDGRGVPLSRFHTDAITRPYASHAKGFGFTSNPTKLVSAWDDQRVHPLSLAYLRRRIYQFLDACATRLFIDSRAILAVSLLDALVTDYYVAREQVSRAQAKKETYFQHRLVYTAAELGIDARIITPICEVVTKTRNDLIHDGRFSADSGRSLAMVWEMMQTHWLTFAFLTRLVDPAIGIRPIYDPRQPGLQFNPVADVDL